MGIRVELPTIRRRRAVSMKGEQVDNFTAVGLGWDADPRAVDQQSLDIDISEFTHPRMKYRAPGIQTSTTAADALSNSPDSYKHLISPYSAERGGSSDPTSPLSYSSQSLSSPSSTSQGCGDTYRREMKKRSEDQGLNPLRFTCSGSQHHDRPSRWDSGRWSPDSNYGSSTNSKRKACHCAGGITGDVAAVCCCPLSLLHLLALALIKLPTAAVVKVMAKIKRRIIMKRKRAVVIEDDIDSVAAASSFPPSRSRSYEEGEVQTWAPASGFGDPRQWREFFGSPDVRASGDLTKELTRVKS